MLEIREDTYELFMVLKCAYQKKEDVKVSDDVFLRFLMQEFAEHINFKGFYFEEKEKNNDKNNNKKENEEENDMLVVQVSFL